MDFFAAQDNARRSTRWLILWFALAVIGIIVTVYLTIAFGLRLGVSPQNGPASWWNGELFLKVAIAVGALILLGSLYKTSQLARGGGAVVAAELGGRLVARDTADPLEQRLVNVVEEMAIAAGIAVPPVYILDNEPGINAFAAGNDISNSVVAVTRGTLQHLSRDELQAVVAHEFSHIFNGDMRLNMRLMGVLHGILLLTLAGRTMARARGKNAAQLAILGLALIVIGYIGVLFGKLIKAAVSRQREFLADASAVQFTRNPGALAGALQRIANAGAAIQHPNAEEASHMFFAKGVSLSQLLSTHPPLEERIRRVDAKAYAEVAHRAKESSPASSLPHTDERASGFSAAGFTDAIGEISQEQVDYARSLLKNLPPGIMQAVHQNYGARAVLFGLFLSPEENVRQKQLQEIQDQFGIQTKTNSMEYAQSFERMNQALRLPAFDLALATLKTLPDENRETILRAIDKLIGMQRELSPSNYIWRTLLLHTLRPKQQMTNRVSSIKALKADTASLLALLSFISSADDTERHQAYAAAVMQAPFDAPWPPYTAPEALSLQEFDRILTTLASTRPLFRKKIVNACVTAVKYDNQVIPTEAELLRVICKILDCPVPPQMQYATSRVAAT